MRKTFFLVACMIAVQRGLSQQLPIFSLYHENGFVLNPAITGVEDHGVIAASYRDQWNRMEGHPRTLSASYRTPVSRTNIGLGGHIVYDVTGPTSYTGATVTFAYHVSFRKIQPFHWARFLRNSKISAGIALSGYYYQLKSSELVLENPVDQAVSRDDQSAFLPNAGLGIYYYYDKFFLGFAAPQLIPLTARFKAADATTRIKRVNHYYVHAGGKIPLGGKVPRGYYNKIYLEPMVWLNYVKGAPLQYDAYFRIRHKNFIWGGAGYRSSKTVFVDIGCLIRKQMQLGYAYDLQVGRHRAQLGHTHEIILAFHFPSRQGSSFGVR
ncbi:MAG: membrane protein [Chitinophagales bacterium]|nr:MAG: membrane protein [Chitinophagales bacterium]